MPWTGWRSTSGGSNAGMNAQLVRATAMARLRVRVGGVGWGQAAIQCDECDCVPRCCG